MLAHFFADIRNICTLNISEMLQWRYSKRKSEVESELNKVAKKKVKLDEIESIEVKESVFGKKVTLSKEDYDKLNDTAKNYVAMEKNIKKLKKERDTAVRDRDKLKMQLSAISSELVRYKKAEEEKRYFSREKLNEQTQKISDREKLRKALAFISACGLSSDYQKFRYSSSTRKNELE